MQTFNEVFQLERDEDYWRWKFMHESDVIAVLAVGADNKVHAQMAAFRTKWCGSGMSLPVSQVGDVFARRTPEIIRHKVMYRTFTTFHRTYSDRNDIKLLFGFPNRTLVELHNTRDPLSESGKPVTMYRLQVEDCEGSSCEPLGSSTRISTDCPSVQAMNDLWLRAKGRYALSSPRDWSWLSWRFLERPDVIDYRFLGCTREDGALVGWAIVRPIDDVLWVCDLVWDGLDAAELHMLESAIVGVAIENDLPEIAIWLQGDERVARSLVESGWRDHTDAQQINLAMHAYDPSLDCDWIQKNLYLTCADSDLF
ncbi:MAG: hypothetical protein WBJ75_06415 [Pseudohongiellaceae bacterium]